MVAEHTQIEFSSADGVRNTLTIAEATKSDSNALILCLPAMGVPARKYDELINSLASNGISAASVDLRGIGNNSIRASRKCNFGYRHLVEYDLPAAIECLLKHYPSKKLILLGHSLGGQIATLHLTQNLKNIEGLILTASCSVYYKGWPILSRWGLLFFTQLASLITIIVGYFPGRKLGFGGREARGVMRDWAYNARSGNYILSGSKINYQPSAQQQHKLDQFPVLCISFADDKFAPVAASEQLLSKLNSLKVDRELIHGSDLGLALADHFNWLAKPQAIADICQHWIKSAIQTSK